MPEDDVREIEEVLMTEVADILAMNRSSVTVDAPFQSLGMNSMAFVELLVVIENTFDLKLMETDLKREDFQDIRSLASRIRNTK